MTDARAETSAPMRLALLASGRGSNVEAILAAIEAGRLAAEPALLICDRREAPVIDVAADHGVPVELVPRADQTDRAAWQAAIAELLVGYRVDLVALAGWASILDPVVVDRFEGRIVNIHPSLLPAFAGSRAPGPQAAALAAGVRTTGCTIHLVTREVDAGPILAQAEVPVLPDDDVDSLSARILAEEHRLYPEVLQRIAAGRLLR